MEKIIETEINRTCNQCGAELTYKPGTQHLTCAYCKSDERIESSTHNFKELELDHYLKLVGESAYTQTIDLLQCKNCGANQHREENVKSSLCVYCNEPLIQADEVKEGWILPSALIPFQLDHQHAKQIFATWVRKGWFSPSKLKVATLDPKKIHGIYLPYWTFDADMNVDYDGLRGEYYYVTESYQTKEGTRTRQVQKIRWYPVSGSVDGFLDDILINASVKKQTEIPAGIANWNLTQLCDFNSKYLAGFTTEKYSVSLKDGNHLSFQRAEEIANNWVHEDIGGDLQQVTHASITLSNETFKHILLPIYFSSYQFNNKEYFFYINGQTGQIDGKRPYSFWKIFFLVLLIIVVILLVSMFAG
ncbi:hypothetical protein [Pedobacter sp. MW01-1-1]|uniref:hypothetical protein n=1 Tax=Pedobacter sp. MW01-1-1 TaxID=3383027 RepID=UPI003FEDF16C